ncbi:MAG: hypothetical protein JO056_10435 [Alphaproteobacteria bacterium]|nr:hypothetical protein [Alphaproteobacteria bacterium]
MQKVYIGAILVTAMAFAVPAAAQAPAPVAVATAVSGFGNDREIVPSVTPGDEIIVACAPIEQRDANADVRVVLTIAAVPSEVSPGFKKVLATDEQLSKYGVRVRVPDVPELPEHTVNLNVYVVGENTRGCDGGHLKVVAKHVPDFRHEVKSSSPIS